MNKATTLWVYLTLVLARALLASSSATVNISACGWYSTSDAVCPPSSPPPSPLPLLPSLLPTSQLPNLPTSSPHPLIPLSLLATLHARSFFIKLNLSTLRCFFVVFDVVYDLSLFSLISLPISPSHPFNVLYIGVHIHTRYSGRELRTIMRHLH